LLSSPFVGRPCSARFGLDLLTALVRAATSRSSPPKMRCSPRGIAGTSINARLQEPDAGHQVVRVDRRCVVDVDDVLVGDACVAVWVFVGTTVVRCGGPATCRVHAVAANTAAAIAIRVTQAGARRSAAGARHLTEVSTAHRKAYLRAAGLAAALADALFSAPEAFAGPAQPFSIQSSAISSALRPGFRRPGEPGKMRLWRITFRLRADRGTWQRSARRTPSPS
jgi:hypothetical protein